MRKEKKCSIKECGRKHNSKGYCELHYRRYRKRGDPHTVLKTGVIGERVGTYKHGKTLTPIYKVWMNMRARCKYPTSNGYKNYGGRGIKVCDRWQEFQNFLEDMCDKTSEGLTLDRIDNDGDYEPSNCRWATIEEQAINKRSTIFVELNGQQVKLQELSEQTGIDYHKLHNRIFRYGMAVERAISSDEPLKKRPYSIPSIRRPVTAIDIKTGEQIEYACQKECAEALNTSSGNVWAAKTGKIKQIKGYKIVGKQVHGVIIGKE